MKKASKVLLHFFLILFFVGLEESALSSKLFLNPVVCFVIFFAMSKDRITIIWPLLGGIFMDFFSIFNFPIFTFSLLALFFIIKFFANKILTFNNQVSFLIFSFGGIIAYNIIFLVINLTFYFLKIDDIRLLFNQFYFLHIFINIIFTLLLLIIFRKNYDKSIFYR